MLTGTQDDDDIVPAGSPAHPCSCLLDPPRTPMPAPAGSPHARVRARWIPARPCPCAMDPRTHACTRSPCVLARRVPTRTRSRGLHTHTHWAHARALVPGPHTCSLAGSPMRACSWDLHTTRTGPMHAHSHQVPTPAHSQGPHTHWLAGSPSALTCGVSILHAPGPCTHTRTRSPRAFARRVPTRARSLGLHTCTLRAHAHALAHRVSMHVYMCLLDASCVHPSAVCIGRVICSSSSTVL